MGPDTEYKQLQEIVNSFNEAFARWTEATQMRVNFGWQYGDGKEKFVKALEVQGIDKIVWRKAPPKSLTEIVQDRV